MRLWASFTVCAAVALVAAALLAGCGGVTTDQFGYYKVEQRHYTIDGRTIRCFLIRTHKGTASLSCDWDHQLP